MSPATFEQFLKFTTDSVGLERTIRLLQATVQIILSYSFVFGLLLHVLNFITAKPPPLAATRPALIDLHQRLNLARRYFRVFRFLESFYAAHKLYLSISPSITTDDKQKLSWVQTEAWIDVFGRSFNGMYLLLDTSTMIDALQVEGLRIWTPEWERTINIEAQRFWLFALACGAFSGLLRMLEILAYTPVPDTGDRKAEGESTEKGKTQKADETAEFEKEREMQRLQSAVKTRKKARVLWMREVRTKLNGLGRNVVANALDIVIPGVIVGWIDLSPGVVGLAMFTTTVLTGIDVWKRCGREVLGKN